MWRLLQSWIFFLLFPASVLLRAECHPARTGNHAEPQGPIQRAVGKRLIRATDEETYWAYSGTYGPDEGWASAYPECKDKNQSPINIVDQDAKVSTEYQELTLEGFATESSNKTSMKNTGKTVAITLKDDYFVRGAGLPGRFKADKVEFHWGPSNGSEGSEHGIDGRRFPVEMQIYMYNSDDFDSLNAALREQRIIAAMAVFFQVREKDNPAAAPIIHGLKGVVHHEKETFLEPFVLKDLLPSSLGSYYRYTGSLTTPPCSKVVEWIIFSRPIYISYKQLEAFYSIFTTEQQDHVKSVEYLRSNFRPIQTIDGRHVLKSAVRDAWMPDLSDNGRRPYDAEPSNVCSSAPKNMKVQHVNSSALVVRWARPEVTYHPPILHFLVSYSWTAHDDSFEETHLTDARQRLEAIISPVSPDVLYLFRVQAICRSDMRSDFSQSMLFRANTTRIFEGTRIVKTGMPTLSSASSADMAPISSGSSTWTSSGIPFSFVSMATGIGPSSSGSQATVASLVTSTLLAGLGFSGGVLASFPSFIWPSRAAVHNPASACQTTRGSGPTRAASAASTAAAKDQGEAGEEENIEGQRNNKRGERADKNKEDKKERKGSEGVNKAERKSGIPDFPALNKKQTERDPINPRPSREVQSEVYIHNPLNSTPATTKGVDEICALPVPEEPAARAWDQTPWSFSVHPDPPNRGTNLTPQTKPGSGAGLGRAERLLPLVVLFSLTFFYLIPLLVVLLHWRRCFRAARFHEEYRDSLTMAPNEIVPFISIQDEMEAIPAKQFIKYVSELFSYNELGLSEDFEEVLRCPADMSMMLDNSNNPHNKCKNRYIDTFAYDHCRVKLRPLAGTDCKHADCINISHVDEPYTFVHEALVEAVSGKRFEMSASRLQSSFSSFTSAGHCGQTHHQKQFKVKGRVIFITFKIRPMLISGCNTVSSDSVTTQKECDKEKGSYQVSVERARVSPAPLCGTRIVDYTEASYIMDDFVLRIRHFQRPREPNPTDYPHSILELIITKEQTTTQAGPALIHDRLGVWHGLATSPEELGSKCVVDVHEVARMINLFTNTRYQDLLKGLFSHVGTKENCLGHLARNFNGAVMPTLGQSDRAVNTEFPV
ncbi:receptor-type tyrosine-protein phosphatase gamma-like [Cololabis saira]|uniref:receptor-type tyrosine-protein phosphatase gamma-like n=1 Tax=Cololabis saira TaxID=129043 RepID=UPI002AD290A8|nr:receptor-type tyrosine-protein phosphatase gamma-like [Cololabis saira]